MIHPTVFNFIVDGKCTPVGANSATTHDRRCLHTAQHSAQQVEQLVEPNVA